MGIEMKSLPEYTAQFADYFRDFTDSYVLIGGVATLYHEEKRTKSASRVTKDLDIVVLDLTENQNSSRFLSHFKSYVKENNYSCSPLGSGKSQNYRFTDPSTGLAPRIIEIISKRFVPENQGSQRLGDSEMSSIALSDDFYDLAKTCKTIEALSDLGGTSLAVATPPALILLKAFAYQNLINSERVDDRSKASKHIADITRLAAILIDADETSVNRTVFAPLQSILEEVDRHFPNSKIINLGWSRKSTAAEVAQSITQRIKQI